MRNVHISLLAEQDFLTITPSPEKYSGFPLSLSNCANASIALRPAGVQAHPSPSTLAIRFVAMYSLAGCSFGIFGKRKLIKGWIPFVIFAISPDFCAISISPTHNAMTPIMVIHKDTASPAESRAALVTSAILPVKAPYTTPIKIINAQI